VFQFVWKFLTDEATFRLLLGGLGLAIMSGQIDMTGVGLPAEVGAVLNVIALAVSRNMTDKLGPNFRFRDKRHA
jgi:hypothetical protein